MTTDLIVAEQINAVQLYDGKSLDPLLKRITEQVKSIVPDVSSAKGRKEIASLAYKVAQSKTALDNAGKDLVAGWKEQAKVVDNERKKMRDYLDKLKDEVREPLTRWEQAEQDRIDGIKQRISTIQLAANSSNQEGNLYDSAYLAERLAEVKAIAINDSFAEFATVAAKEKDMTVTTLENLIVKRKQEEADKAELERLRREAEEKAEEERREQLRCEGEERARKEAEEKAKAEQERAAKEAAEKEAAERRERDRIEQEKQAAIEAKLAAERRAKEAEENAKREAEEAVKREQERIARQQEEERKAQAAREADKKHRATINNAIKDALVSGAGIDCEQAKAVVAAIATGKIPYTKISY